MQSAAVLLLRTAGIRQLQAGGPRNALKRPKNHPKRVRPAPWPRANGFYDLAIRSGAVGVRNAASWGPCGPLDLGWCPVCGPFASLLTWGEGRPDEPRNGQNGTCPQTLREGQTDRFGSPRACPGPFSAFLTHFSPVSTWVSRLCDGVLCGSKMASFKSGPQNLREGQTDLYGPFWAHFDQFYGYAGYRIPAHWAKGGWMGARRAKSPIKHLIGSSVPL